MKALKPRLTKIRNSRNHYVNCNAKEFACRAWGLRCHNTTRRFLGITTKKYNPKILFIVVLTDYTKHFFITHKFNCSFIMVHKCVHIAHFILSLNATHEFRIFDLIFGRLNIILTIYNSQSNLFFTSTVSVLYK